MKHKINFIAEIGINHNGDINIAKQLIDCAKLTGCDFVKFQKRDPDISVPQNKKKVKVNTPWGKMNYIDYKKKIEFDLSDYEQLDEYCRQKQIGWFVSCWDIPSAKTMYKINTMTKIPSAKLNDKKLCKFVDLNFKFKILSTGMSTQKQIDSAIKNLNPQVVMHTVSTYPCPIEELNLSYIKFLSKKFPKIQIGYSGHEYGLSTTFAAVGMGATWIERHITLDRHMWGSDQLSSVEPAGLFQLISGIRAIERSFGKAEPRKIKKSEIEKLKSLRG